MKKALVALVAVLLLNAACTYAQTNTPPVSAKFADDYDAFIRKTIERFPDIPAIAVVVVKDDKPIFVQGYGVADKEAGAKADSDTLFYIASSTKSFTAMAAALLDKEGKIRLGDPVTKYSSGISLNTLIPDKVTIRDLLDHTSGLKNDVLVFRMAFSGESDPRDMARVFAEGTTFADANYGKYAYDNLGYNIYAVLLQNHLKTKWQDLLQQRLFDPLGMKHTTAYFSKAAAKNWKVAAPYYFDGVTGKVIRSPLPKTDSNMQAAGGVFTSIADMGRWLVVNMNDGKLDGSQVLPADVVRAAHTGYTKTSRSQPPFTGEGEYGLGWQIGQYRDQKVIYHHGGFPGYFSHVSFMPEKKIGVAVLVNDGTAGPPVGHMLAVYAYDALLGTADREANYSKLLQDFRNQYERETANITASAADRAKRTWQLTAPLAEYTGRFVNELLGTIVITNKGSGLNVSMGNINVVPTPFTQPDTIRVEMEPGRGEVIKFDKNADGKFPSLSYRNATFTKAAP